MVVEDLKTKYMNTKGYGTRGASKEIRTQEAAMWLMDNPDAKTTEFVDWAVEVYDIKKRMAFHLRKDALNRVAELVDENLIAKKKTSAISLENMLRKAIDKGDIKLALQIRQEISKTLGLYVQNVDITSAGDKLDNFSIANLIGFNKDGGNDNETETED